MKPITDEQPYIDNRLIPHMKKNKLSLPIIEIYIHIIDGAHRIVALRKLGIKRIPFIIYEEPYEN